jgi:hypothetical protein
MVRSVAVIEHGSISLFRNHPKPLIDLLFQFGRFDCRWGGRVFRENLVAQEATRDHDDLAFAGAVAIVGRFEFLGCREFQGRIACGLRRGIAIGIRDGLDKQRLGLGLFAGFLIGTSGGQNADDCQDRRGRGWKCVSYLFCLLCVDYGKRIRRR